AKVLLNVPMCISYITMMLKLGSVNAGILKFGSTMTDWGLSSLPGKPKPSGKVKSSQLLSPRIVEFARHSPTLNGISILVSRLGPRNRADPNGIRGIGVAILLGQRHRSSAIGLDGHSVHEWSPNAKRGASIAMRGRPKWISRARPQC